MEAKEENGQTIKVDENIDIVSITDRVKSSTTPLWNVPYEKQVRL